VSLIDATAGGMYTTREAVIAGMPIAIPMLDIHTVGAGGGSIARYDAGGILHVGPESAGAKPGPVCYGRGDSLTVTDANLLLGRLDPDDFLGGAMVLDEQRTLAFASEYIAGAELVEDFAAGVLLVAEAAMEKAIRVISVERGYDPREFTLLSFGGAGPLHACALARSLSVPRVLVPRMPGALSALGILLADAVRDYSKTVMLSYTEESIKQRFRELEMRAISDLDAGSEPVIERSIDLRYRGEGYEVSVPAGADALERFHQAHRMRYGYADESRPVEVVTVRVRVVLRECAVELATEPCLPGNGSHAIIKQRQVYFDAAAFDTPVYVRSMLRHGDAFQGPALIAEYSATTVVRPPDLVSVDKYGNLIIKVACA
jgi:N-methylhydantoinase A